jgi:hypothetical protein
MLVLLLPDFIRSGIVKIGCIKPEQMQRYTTVMIQWCSCLGGLSILVASYAKFSAKTEVPSLYVSAPKR